MIRPPGASSDDGRRRRRFVGRAGVPERHVDQVEPDQDQHGEAADVEVDDAEILAVS